MTLHSRALLVKTAVLQLGEAIASWGLRWLFLGAVASTNAYARQTKPTRAVSGLAFDSIRNAPLVGAIVTIASSDPGKLPVTAKTDSSGHYRVVGLDAGRYLIAFEHEAALVWGIDLPAQSFDLGQEESRELNLAIPPGADVRSMRCGKDSISVESTLWAGLISSGDPSVALANVQVDATWPVIVFEHGTLRYLSEHASATTSPDGTFAICSIPRNASIHVQVRHGGYYALSGQINIADVSVARNDFLLASVELTRGRASLVGSAFEAKGKPIRNGHALIDALSRDVPIQDGKFALTELPNGTWDLSLRAIGFAPVEAFVTTVDSGPTLQSFTVEKSAQPLDAVRILGMPARATAILTEVVRRHRASAGTIFLPGSPALEAAVYASDVLRAARGFSFKGPLNVQARNGCGLRGAMPDLPRSSARAAPKAIAVYLNGDRFPLGFEALNRLIMMRDILAIEAFPDVLTAPVEWRTNDACAVVVVWTKQ